VNWHLARARCHRLGGTVGRMEITARHREVESRFRALVADNRLPEPDGVRYEQDAVVFLWEEPKLAVCVDFDEADDLPSAA
jgi:hypothetical protein